MTGLIVGFKYKICQCWQPLATKSCHFWQFSDCYPALDHSSLGNFWIVAIYVAI